MRAELSSSAADVRDLPPRGGRGAFRLAGLALLAVLALGLDGAWHGLFSAERPAATAAARAQPVRVQAAKLGDMPVYLSGLGTVVPANSVLVRSRVDGQLMQLHFTEGQTVKEGALLAEIDPRPFQAQLTQALGQLAKDQALLDNAQRDLKRYEVLAAEDTIARQQLDTQQSLVRQYIAAVAVDQGVVENARLQLSYCRITAPVSGRLGLRQVDPGNIIHASDQTGIVSIAQVQPIMATFTIPEGQLPQVLKAMQTNAHPPVEAWDREMQVKLAEGTLLTLDNQIDATTATIRLKAQFANADGRLFPNQFINARLLVGVVRGAVLIPGEAIQRGSQGPFVYVVDQDKKARLRVITLGVSGGGSVVVQAGVADGEQLVIDGLDKLRDGAPVEVAGS